MFPPNFTNKKYQPPGHKKVPERTRGKPEEGAGDEQGAKGKKKGSIRGGVLPYVGEGR